PTEVPVVAPNPSYTLLKGASITTDNGTADVADVDDVITYTFTVANTGNVTLSDVVVSDPLPNIGTITPASATIEPGATAVFTATYTVTQDDVDTKASIENVATVNGNSPDDPNDPDGAPDPLDPVESSPEDPANPGDPVPGTVP